MTDRDNALWRQCWQGRDIDFHQLAVNPLLARFWPGLALPAGSRVFVPLCGKSLDMLWLAAQGYEVVGVELSPLAVRAFFRENRLRPERRRVGKFVLWQHGRVQILCGDYFDLTCEDLGAIDAVYDRAALTALAEDIRVDYVAHLRTLVSRQCQVFLLTVEDAEEGETLDQSHAAAAEIERLYARDFACALAHVESMYESDPATPTRAPQRSEHKLYRLTAKPRIP